MRVLPLPLGVASRGFVTQPSGVAYLAQSPGRLQGTQTGALQEQEQDQIQETQTQTQTQYTQTQTQDPRPRPKTQTQIQDPRPRTKTQDSRPRTQDPGLNILLYRQAACLAR